MQTYFNTCLESFLKMFKEVIFIKLCVNFPMYLPITKYYRFNLKTFFENNICHGNPRTVLYTECFKIMHKHVSRAWVGQCIWFFNLYFVLLYYVLFCFVMFLSFFLLWCFVVLCFVMFLSFFLLWCFVMLCYVLFVCFFCGYTNRLSYMRAQQYFTTMLNFYCKSENTFNSFLNKILSIIRVLMRFYKA